jgi:hypothetical protein
MVYWLMASWLAICLVEYPRRTSATTRAWAPVTLWLARIRDVSSPGPGSSRIRTVDCWRRPALVRVHLPEHHLAQRMEWRRLFGFRPEPGRGGLVIRCRQPAHLRRRPRPGHARLLAQRQAPPYSPIPGQRCRTTKAAPVHRKLPTSEETSATRPSEPHNHEGPCGPQYASCAHNHTATQLPLLRQIRAWAGQRVARVTGHRTPNSAWLDSATRPTTLPIRTAAVCASLMPSADHAA